MKTFLRWCKAGCQKLGHSYHHISTLETAPRALIGFWWNGDAFLDLSLCHFRANNQGWADNVIWGIQDAVNTWDLDFRAFHSKFWLSSWFYDLWQKVGVKLACAGHNDILKILESALWVATVPSLGQARYRFSTYWYRCIVSHSWDSN